METCKGEGEKNNWSLYVCMYVCMLYAGLATRGREAETVEVYKGRGGGR